MTLLSIEIVQSGKKISICHPCVLRHGGDHVLYVVDYLAVDPPGDVEQAVHSALYGETPLEPHRRRALLHAGALVHHFLRSGRARVVTLPELGQMGQLEVDIGWHDTHQTRF